MSPQLCWRQAGREEGGRGEERCVGVRQGKEGVRWGEIIEFSKKIYSESFQNTYKKWYKCDYLAVNIL